MHAIRSRSLQSPPNLVSIPSVARPGGAWSSHTTPGSRHNSRLSSLGAPSAIAPHPFGQLDTPARLALARPSPRVPSTYLSGFDAPIAKILGSLRSPATPTQPWRSTLRPSSALNSRCARHASSSPASQPTRPQLGLTHNTGRLQDRKCLGMSPPRSSPLFPSLSNQSFITPCCSLVLTCHVPGLWRHWLARRHPAVLPRTQRPRKGILAEAQCPCQEIL
jgi:hypothetical protein